MKNLFKGEITGLEPEFRQRSAPHPDRQRLRPASPADGEAQDADIPEDARIATSPDEIAGDWSLTPDVTDTRVTFDYVLQHNQTDFEFLARARAADRLRDGGERHHPATFVRAKNDGELLCSRSIGMSSSSISMRGSPPWGRSRRSPCRAGAPRTRKACVAKSTVRRRATDG